MLYTERVVKFQSQEVAQKKTVRSYIYFIQRSGRMLHNFRREKHNLFFLQQNIFFTTGNISHAVRENNTLGEQRTSHILTN